MMTARPLGRDTAATVRTKPEWERLVAAAPHVFSGSGEATQVSPPLWRYCPGGANVQVIGCCVGMGTKNAASTILRIPPGCKFDPNDPAGSTPPLPTIRLSGLYSYWLARNAHGRPDGRGDGAVVAYAMDGASRYGVVPEGLWPDTGANQHAYDDRRAPSRALLAAGAAHAVHAARVTSSGQYLDFLAAGYPVVDGVEITEGWMDTDGTGRFRLDGGVVGGHCTAAVGFDKAANRLYKRNSWQRWGVRTNDPEFADAGGYSNVGFCDLDQYVDTYLTDDKFASGEADAFVISLVPWDRPQAPNVTLFDATDIF